MSDCDKERSTVLATEITNYILDQLFNTRTFKCIRIFFEFAHIFTHIRVGAFIGATRNYMHSSSQLHTLFNGQTICVLLASVTTFPSRFALFNEAAVFCFPCGRLYPHPACSQS